MLHLVSRNLRNFKNTQDGIVGFRVFRRGTVSLSLCAMVFSGPREKEKGIQSCASNIVKNSATRGLGSTQSTIRIMKENGIVVAYEWAYNEVMRSHDFTGKSPAWVESFVEGWRDGYLKGFLKGWTEETIRNVCRMKRAGLASDKIAAFTDVSLDVIKMITA